MSIAALGASSEALVVSERSLDTFQPGQVANQVFKVAANQGLTSGDPDLFDTQADENGSDPYQFFERQEFFLFDPYVFIERACSSCNGSYNDRSRRYGGP